MTWSVVSSCVRFVRSFPWFPGGVLFVPVGRALVPFGYWLMGRFTVRLSFVVVIY